MHTTQPPTRLILPLILILFTALACTEDTQYNNMSVPSTTPSATSIGETSAVCSEIQSSALEARHITLYGNITKNNTISNDLFAWALRSILVFRSTTHPERVFSAEGVHGRGARGYEIQIPTGTYDVFLRLSSPQGIQAPVGFYDEIPLRRDWRLDTPEEGFLQRADFDLQTRNIHLSLSMGGQPLPTDRASGSRSSGFISFASKDSPTWRFPVPLGERTFSMEIPATAPFSMAWDNAFNAVADVTPTLPQARIQMEEIPAGADDFTSGHDLSPDVISIELDLTINGRSLRGLGDGPGAPARGLVVFTSTGEDAFSAMYSVPRNGDAKIQALLPAGHYGIYFSPYQLAEEDEMLLDNRVASVDCDLNASPCLFTQDTTWTFDLNNVDDSFDSPPQSVEELTPVEGSVELVEGVPSSLLLDENTQILFYDHSNLNGSPFTAYFTVTEQKTPFSIELPVGEYRVAIAHTGSNLFGTRVVQERLVVGPEGVRDLEYTLSATHLQAEVTLNASTMPDGTNDPEEARGQIVFVHEVTRQSFVFDLGVQGAATLDTFLLDQGRYEVFVRSVEEWRGRTYVRLNTQEILPNGHRRVGVLDLSAQGADLSARFDLQVIDFDISLTLQNIAATEDDRGLLPRLRFTNERADLWINLDRDALRSSPVSTSVKLYADTYDVELGEHSDYAYGEDGTYTFTAAFGQICVGHSP